MPEQRAARSPYARYDESAHRRTLSRGWAKIHAGCGGLVRYVEAWDQPGVGWTGECVHCGSTRIDEERIVFVTDPAVPDDIGDVTDLIDHPESDLAELEYPKHVQQQRGFEAAQETLAEQITEVLLS